MSSRVAGAGLALIAAALLSAVIATPVLVPAEMSLFAGHPTVNGHLREVQTVYVGLYEAELCNNGGDGTCKSGDATTPFRYTALGELGLVSLLLLGTLVLGLLPIKNTERRKGLARANGVVGVLALGGAGALIVLGPFQQAEIPLNPLAAALYGVAILAALLTSLVAARPAPTIKLRASKTPAQPVLAQPPPSFDAGALSANGAQVRREDRLPHEPRAEASDPFAPQPRVDQPLFSSAPLLRPLYDATPMQGGTGGLIGMERPPEPARAQTSVPVPMAMAAWPTQPDPSQPVPMAAWPTEPEPSQPVPMAAWPAEPEPSQPVPIAAWPAEPQPSQPVPMAAWPAEPEPSLPVSAPEPSRPVPMASRPPPPPRGKAASMAPPPRAQVSSPMPGLAAAAAQDLSASYDPTPMPSGMPQRMTGSSTDISLAAESEGRAPSAGPSRRQRVDTPLASPPPPLASSWQDRAAFAAPYAPGLPAFDPSNERGFDAGYEAGLETIRFEPAPPVRPSSETVRFEQAQPAAASSTAMRFEAAEPPTVPALNLAAMAPAAEPSAMPARRKLTPTPPPPASSAAMSAPIPSAPPAAPFASTPEASLATAMPTQSPRPARDSQPIRATLDVQASRPALRATVPMPARLPQPAPRAPGSPTRAPLPTRPPIIPRIPAIAIPVIPAIPAAKRGKPDLDDRDDLGDLRAYSPTSLDAGETTNVSDIPSHDTAPRGEPVAAAPTTLPPAPRLSQPKLAVSTAPASLPPPKDAKQAAGPSPACPQCESPMSWVEEHLRFYCKSCRMYF